MDARPTPRTDAVLASKVRPEDDHLTVRALQLRDLCRQLERSNAELVKAIKKALPIITGIADDERDEKRRDGWATQVETALIAALRNAGIET